MTAEIITLPSGRRVLDTGKVAIGILAPARPADLGLHAEQVQAALLSHNHCSKRGAMADREELKTQHVRGMHDAAMRVIHLDTSLTARLWRFVGRIFGSK